MPIKCLECNVIDRDKIIECSECPYGHYGECGWARCPTQEEWNMIKAYFKEKK